jgi:hypothetical protein
VAVGVIAGLVLLPGGARAAEFELGFVAGGRFDGELRDPVDFSRVPLDAAPSRGVFGRLGLIDGVGVEIAWSRSTTDLDVSRAVSVPPGLQLRIEHLQAGLQLELGQRVLRPFVGVAAGASRFTPSRGDAEPEYAFSVGGVVGVYWTLLDRIRLRLEGRGFASRPDREGGTFCSDAPAGVCEVRNPDGFFFQSQVGLGLSVVF